jgi:molybdopterin-containing oxidoreductase family membrane subunit
MNVHTWADRPVRRSFPPSPRALVDGLLHEIRRSSARFRLWMGFLLVLLVFFADCAVVALPPGWEVAGTTPTFEWGLFIVGYVFFAILTSGLCLSASLGTVFGIERFRPFEKRHLVLAILSLTAAFMIIALDLHYPVRMVFGAVLVPSPTSPMWWMGVFYGGYLVFLLVEAFATWTHRRRLHQVTSLLTTTTAIAAPMTLGAVFGALAAKPFWYGVFTPVLMIASALLAGAALLGLVFGLVTKLRLEGAERAVTLAMPAVRILLGFSVVMVGVLLARHVVAGLISSTAGAPEAALALIAGPLAIPFWIRVAVGLGIPLAIVLTPAGRTTNGILAASLLALPMVFLDRYLFVAGGQVAPITAVSGNVVETWATYFPSIVEIGVVVGAAAFVAMGYTLAERYMDMREAPEGHPPIPLARVRAGFADRLGRLLTWTDRVAFARRRVPADPAGLIRTEELEEARREAALQAGDGGAM